MYDNYEGHPRSRTSIIGFKCKMERRGSILSEEEVRCCFGEEEGSGDGQKATTADRHDGGKRHLLFPSFCCSSVRRRVIIVITVIATDSLLSCERGVERVW